MISLVSFTSLSMRFIEFCMGQPNENSVISREGPLGSSSLISRLSRVAFQLTSQQIIEKAMNTVQQDSTEPPCRK